MEMDRLADPVWRLVRCRDKCGQVPYSLAAECASKVGILGKFAALYGGIADWNDPDLGDPLGIDVGEFAQWVWFNLYT